MPRQTINIGTSPNDGTGDPLRTAFDKTNDNFLEVYADGGGVITVNDPTTSTDAPLNDALQNIFDSGGGGVPTLPEVLAQGNREILKIGDAVETYTTVLADRGKLIFMPSTATLFTELIIDNIYNVGDTILFYSQGGGGTIKTTGTGVFLPDFTTEISTVYAGDLIKITLVDNSGGDFYYTYNVIPYQVTSGGVTDGDKGDITVSGSGTVWTIDNQAVTRQKLEHIQTAHVLGRHASGTGDVQEVSPSQLRTIINVQDGAQVNNISDVNATDLTDGGNTTLHTHDSRYYTESEVDTFINTRVRTLLNDNVDSSNVTGTVANTILKSYLVPANTLAVGDTIDFKSVVSVTGTNATKLLRLATNTSNSLSGALTLATLSAVNTSRYLSLDRTYTLKTGNVLQSFPTGSSAVTDESTVSNPPDSTAFNPAVDNWFLIAIQPNSSLDSFIQTLCYITLMKAKTTI